jgi:hypothetical protein
MWGRNWIFKYYINVVFKTCNLRELFRRALEVELIYYCMDSVDFSDSWSSSWIHLWKALPLRYCHDFGLAIYGVWFIEHLQNVTTNIYDILTELHSPKITVATAHIKSSQFAVSWLVVAWWRISTMSSASMLTFLPAGDCLTTNSLLQLSILNWLSLTVLLITSRHGPHRKHCSSVAVSNCCRANMLVCETATQ